MNYKDDFIFYLLPSGAIFSDYFSRLGSLDDIPKFTKNDFEGIVDIALKHEIFNKENEYLVKEKLKQLILAEQEVEDQRSTRKPKEDIVSKLDLIYDSHMGVSLLYDLYHYDYLCSLKKENIPFNNKPVTNRELIMQGERILSNIVANNSPIKELKIRG